MNEQIPGTNLTAKPAGFTKIKQRTRGHNQAAVFTQNAEHLRLDSMCSYYK